MIFKTNKKTTLLKQATSWFLIFLMFLQSFSGYAMLGGINIATNKAGSSFIEEPEETASQTLTPGKKPVQILTDNPKGESDSTKPESTVSSGQTANQAASILKSNTLYRFSSDLSEGIIGIAEGKHADEPSDNLFRVNINQKIEDGDRAYLVYDLWGVSDYTGISKSINDRLSTGGTFVKINREQTRQREEINPAWIKAGENTILFTLPENTSYSYKIANLSIEIEKGNKAESIVIEKSIYTKDGKTYIKGFVNTADAQRAKIALDGKPLANMDGAFEALLDVTAQPQLTAALSGDKTLEKNITFTEASAWDFENPLQTDFSRISKKFAKGEAGSLEGTGASLKIDSFALDIAKNISLTSLRDIDLPALNADLSNVTAAYKGYRFLPHGEHFAQAAKVAIGYDRTRLPSGYTENDIQTFYFDTKSGHWQALERDSIDRQNQVIISKTTHFTDMINGVIKTPESPETAGYTPTAMSSIQAADPTAKVQMIAPPSANQRGSASMSYAFEMPPARNGMAPSLGIDYNSDRGEAWLGEGWDLSVPSITVDTRWGVPRYDSEKETETYSLSGQMLITYDDHDSASVAHRGDKIARKADRQFYPRSEGSFARIVRKGNAPGNYTWEIVDKAGTKYTYATPLKGTITTINGQTKEVIAQWMLTRVEEVHGDWIEYAYDNTDEPVKGSLTAEAIYLKQVRTGNKGQDAHTVVTLTSNTQKQKQTNNARYGFLTSSNKLLDKVAINFAGQALRSYSFSYKDGAFQTKVLDKVTHNDNTGKEFASHTFDYYDDVDSKSGYKPFKSQEENWDLKDDNIQAGFVNPVSSLNNTDFTDKASALGGSKTVNKSYGGSVGVGIPVQLWNKNNSAGGNYSHSTTDSKGLSTLVDINGDGLPDKVFVDGGNLYYRPSLLDPVTNQMVYGEKIKIKGINEFSKSSSRTNTFGFYAQVGLSGVASAVTGWDKSHTNTETSTYFADVNNDGLIDIVKDRQVYFNHIEFDRNGNAVPTFTLSSADTPSPIIAGGVIDDSDTRPDPSEQDTLIKYSPMHDIVRVWEAPFSGTVKIEGKVQLQIPSGEYDQAEYAKADGVRIAIQVAGSEKWSKSIAKGDNTPYEAAVNGITVEQGQKIYFRLQSGNQRTSNGSFDEVNWEPVIIYTDALHVNATNPDGQGSSIFKASEGDVLSIDNMTYVPASTSYKVTGNFTKPVTSDDVTLKVILSNNKENPDGSVNPAYRETTAYEQIFKWNETFNGNLDIPLTNNPQDTEFRFQVQATSNVAWEKVKWTPSVETLQDGKSSATKAFVYYSIHNKQITYGNHFVMTADTTLSVTPQLAFSAPASGKIMMTVKNTTGLLTKKELTVANGILSGDATLSGVRAKAGNIWVEYTVTDQALKPFLTGASAMITPAVGSAGTVPANSFASLPDVRFSTMCRGWGAFTYNTGEDRFSRPIDESLLKLPESEEDADLMKMALIPVIPDIETKSYWTGQNERIYIKGQEMSSARLAEQDVIPGNLFDGLPPVGGLTGGCLKGTGATAIPLFSKNESSVVQVGASADLGIPGASGTLNKAEGWEQAITSFTDMNGDGYPDIVTKDQIQVTNSHGGLDGEIIRGNYTQYSTNSSFAVALGGSAVVSFTATSGNNTRQNKNKIAITGAQASVSGTGNWNKDQTEYTLIDINGDGLPDKVTKDKKVMLNLGYSFAPETDWGLSEVQKGQSDSYSFGGGTGLNFDIASSSISGGIGLTTTRSNVQYTLSDVNSDGLPDKVRKDGDRIYVSLNTGNSFASEILWNGWQDISKSSSTAESVNASFTIGIPILVTKLTINPGVAISQAMNRAMVDLRDVDGDGYPDVVSSDKDSKMTVKRSAIARTGKLKTVTNPLGGTFTLDYERSAATYDHPGGKWVLSSVVADDKLADDGPVVKNRFRYENGRQERHERDFLGFGRVIIENIDSKDVSLEKIYRRSVEEFDVSNYYAAGNPVKSYITDSLGNKYVENTKSYYSYEVSASGDYYKFRQDAVCSDRSAAYTPLRYTQSMAYEGQKEGMVTSQEHFYYLLDGNFGEIDGYKYSDKGTLDNSGSGAYNYQTRVEYAHNRDKHILSLPVKVWTGVYGGTTIRQSTAGYDLAYGHLMQVNRLMSSYDKGQYAVTDFVYDNAGNIKQKTLPVNNWGQRMIYKYLYDRDYNMYVERIEDSFGYRTEFENYDYRYGIPLTQRDINGYQMKTAIDNMGRITSVTSPNELAVNVSYKTIEFEYNPKGKYARTIHNDYFDASGVKVMNTYTHVDGFGRPVQVKKDAEVEGSLALVVSGRVKYDSFGRAIEAYHPTTGTRGDMTFNPVFDDVTPTHTAYDILDRATSVTLPDGSVTASAYSLEKNTRSMVTTLTDAMGARSASFTNGSGLVTRTEQYSGPKGTITTRFEYDGIGQQTGVVDTEGNRTMYNYDEGGRMYDVHHPWGGLSHYWFDAAGNLYQAMTPNLAAIPNKYIYYGYEYNRLKEVTYASSTNKGNKVKYSYGSPNATDNTAGRLILVEDETGARQFSYGRLGEIIKERRTVIVPNTAIATYETQWKYDSWGRIREMVYPDNEKLTYSYDTGGALKSLKGEKAYSYNYIQDIKYNKFGSRSLIKYCNGVETNYTYNPLTLYMDNLKVTSTQKNQTIMDNAYGFDKVGNVLSVTNSAPLPSVGGMGGQMKHTYAYDGLYRLIHAEGSYTSSNAAQTMGGAQRKAAYSLDMTYDNIHNITSKKQSVEQTGISFNGTLKAGYDLKYNYRADNKFKLQSIEDNNYRTEKIDKQDVIKNIIDYQYDADGNVKGETTHRFMKDGTRQDSINKRNILWNDFDRMEAVNENGYVSNYTYDFVGERTIKLLTSNTEGIFVNGTDAGQRTQTLDFTLYVSPYFVTESGGKYTKHIYAGTERIVSKLGDSDSYGADPRRIEYAGSGTSFKPDYKTKYTQTQNEIKERYNLLQTPYTNPDQNDYVNGKGFCCNDNSQLKAAIVGNEPQNYEQLQYYYHPDHLGSTSLITNLDGEIVQHVEYVPFGEVFIEERNNTWNTPFLFNAKELDEETGLYYYGARYYNSKTGLWLSVDPMWMKYPGVSAFAYCHNNPINRIDQDGMTDFIANDQHQYVNDGTNQVIEISTENFEYLKNNSFDSNNEKYNEIITNGTVRADLFYTVENVLAGKDYVPYNGNCNAAARKQNNVSSSGADGSIQMLKTKNSISNMKDFFVPEEFANGIAYLKDQLTSENSIMVGAYQGPKDEGNVNKLTGHFFNVVGMGIEFNKEEKRFVNYFSYYDNGSRNEVKGTNLINNRLYFGTTENTNLRILYDFTNGGGRSNSSYMITEVRLNIIKQKD